jgi:hypothetical protein
MARCGGKNTEGPQRKRYGPSESGRQCTVHGIFPSESPSSFELRIDCHQPIRLRSSCCSNFSSYIRRAGTLLVWCARHDLLRLCRPGLHGSHAAGRNQLSVVSLRSCSFCSRSAFDPNDSASAPAYIVADVDPRLTALSWDFLPYDALSIRQRPTPEFPPLAVLRPQVFATSRRFIPPDALRPCFMSLAPMGFRLQSFPCRVAGLTSRLTSLTSLFLSSASLDLNRVVSGSRNPVGARIPTVRAVDFGVTRSLQSLLS